MESWPKTSYMHSLELGAHPIISPVPEYIIGIDILGSWQNIKIGFWAYGVISIVISTVRELAGASEIGLHSTVKTVNQK